MLYYSLLFTLTQPILNSLNFVANLALSRLLTFLGALLAENWWRGAQKLFSGPGGGQGVLMLKNCIISGEGHPL